MGKKKAKRIEGSLDGLAGAFEESTNLRRRVLKQNSLLTWPTPAQKGVINMGNIALNHEPLEILIKHWAKQFEDHVMIPVDLLKNEARSPTI